MPTLRQQELGRIRNRRWRNRHYEELTRKRLENKIFINERLKEWRIKNPDKVSLHNKKAREKRSLEDKAKWLEYRKEWDRKHPAQARQRCITRRARKANVAVNSFTSQEWEYLKAAYNFRCAYCREKKPLAMDHIIALSRGGNHCASNIVPACKSCNSRKGPREAPMFQPVLFI